MNPQQPERHTMHNVQSPRTDDDAIEAEIKAKGLTAPRVTPADIEANIASAHYFIASDAILFADRLPASAYDLAYADPPYGSRKLDRILETWQRTPFARTLVLEHAADHDVPKPARSRRIEDTVLSVYESS